MTNNRIHLPPVPPVTPGSGKPATPVKPAGSGSFNQILEQRLKTEAPLRFSQHAQNRLQTRRIELSAADLTQITAAVDKAAEKGAKESLILQQNRAFVVSIPNRTVITVVDEASLKENVFTNIDSAVIL